MLRVGIVGTGVAGGATALELHRSDVKTALSLFDRRGRTGGRAGTGRSGDLVYDYGANYISTDEDRVNRVLDGVVPEEERVHITEPVYTIDGDRDVTPGREATSPRWSCRDGIQTIPDRLLAAADGTVHLETTVDRLERRGDIWTLHGDSEAWGPFDAIVLTAPPAETAAILEGSPSLSVDEERIAALQAHPFKRVLSGVLRYPFEIDVPYYALLNQDRTHPVGWIARESVKDAHVPAGEEVLIVQANHDWSLEHFDADPDIVVEKLAQHCHQMMDHEGLENPLWHTVHRWRYAMPLEERSTGPSIPGTPDGCYVAGDWTVGEGRLETAIVSGLRCADRLIDEVREEREE